MYVCLNAFILHYSPIRICCCNYFATIFCVLVNVATDVATS